MNRRNVIELLGEHSRKYHSCLMTTYSIDFGFFEQRLLPALHRMQVGNIHVLLDAHELEQAQQFLTVQARTVHAGYSVQPISPEKGVFHPKILLLLGEKNGLLLIGSGNLTGSGLQSNEEVWSAFQVEVSTEIPAYAVLLSNALGWLEQWKPSDGVSLSSKWRWMREYTPWLEELSNRPVLDAVPLPDGRRVQFLGQDGTRSTLDSMADALGERRVKRATAVSPFYDRDASGLQALIARTGSGEVDVLLDEDRIPFGHFEGPSFFDWKSRWVKDEKTEHSRLHAKLYHFELEGGIEAIYVGSSNATMAGLGVNTSGARNVEAGIWMERRQPAKSWVDGLGLRKGSVPLEPWKEANHDIMPAPEHDRRSRRAHWIQYAEYAGREILLKLTSRAPVKSKEVDVVIRDRDGVELARSRARWLDAETLNMTLEEGTVPFGFIYLDQDGSVVSNAVPIHAKADIDRANPDPLRQKLEQRLREFSSMGWDIERVFQYEDGFRSEATSIEKATAASSKVATSRGVPENSFAVLSTEELNHLASVQAEEEQRILQSSTSRLADFMNAYLGELRESDAPAVEESEEQRLLLDEEGEQEGGGDALESVHEQMTFHEGDVRAVRRYSMLCRDRYNRLLEQYYTAPIINGPFAKTRVQVTFEEGYRDLSMVAMITSGHVLLLTDDKASRLQQAQRLKMAKEFLEDQIGSFCLLARGGFIHRSPVSEYFVNKVFDRIDDVVGNWIFIWVALHWARSERKQAALVALNLRMLLNQLRKERGPVLWPELKTRILDMAVWSEEYRPNLDLLEAATGPSFDDWWERYEAKERVFVDSSALSAGQWIVRSQMGMSEVVSITRRASAPPTAHLIHLGRRAPVRYDLASRSIIYPIPSV